MPLPAITTIPVALGSYQAMLDHPDIDAIYISLPNSLHAEWTIKAAEAGKHVFCEKPLAVTAAEGRQMVEACRKADVLLFEAFVFMHHPQSRRLKEIIAAGEIGTLRHINAGMTFVVNDPSNIRLIKALGGGSIYDGGVYPITFSRFIAGNDPISVQAHMRFDAQAGVDVAHFAHPRIPRRCHRDLVLQFRRPRRCSCPHHWRPRPTGCARSVPSRRREQL